MYSLDQNEKGPPVLGARIMLSLQEEPLFNAGLTEVYGYVECYDIYFIEKEVEHGIVKEKFLFSIFFHFLKRLKNACLHSY